jgi:uncharacterized membrane protein YciS (DUF1049 family)
MDEERKGIVTTNAPHPLTTVVQVPAEIVMYNVSEPELDAIASSSSSIHLVFFGISVGALIAFAIVMCTASLGVLLFATFAALLAVSILATAYFGIRTRADIKANTRRLSRIKQRRQS